MNAPLVEAVAAKPDQQRAFARVMAGVTGPVTALPGYPISSLWDGYEPPRYLLKGILEPAAVTVLFGMSGHFKSFLARDMMLCVATGRPFHGLPVNQGAVLLVAGEGHGGLRKRFRAWLMHNGYTAEGEQPPVFVTTAGADLISNPDQVAATVKQAAALFGVDIALVVIDTLAASFGSGDENLAGDMSLAIAGARAGSSGAAVLLVHHTGHAEGARERGSSALAAAADFRLQATYSEADRLLEMKWLKAKDDERPEPVLFQWSRMGVGWRDVDEQELTSVILERLEGASLPQGTPKVTGLGKHQETALKALRTLYARARKNVEADGRDPAEARILLDGWKRECASRGIPRQRISDLVSDLAGADRRLITIEGPHVLLVKVA